MKPSKVITTIDVKQLSSRFISFINSLKKVILSKVRTQEVRENIKLPVFYLLLAGSFAGWQTLYNVHLDSIGYSSIQIGSLNALFISTSAIVVPFWGMLADKFGNNRVLLLLSTAAGLLVFFIGKTMVFHWMHDRICTRTGRGA